MGALGAAGEPEDDFSLPPFVPEVTSAAPLTTPPTTWVPETTAPSTSTTAAATTTTTTTTTAVGTTEIMNVESFEAKWNCPLENLRPATLWDLFLVVVGENVRICYVVF
jgi:hypothetical protein